MPNQPSPSMPGSATQKRMSHLASNHASPAVGQSPLGQSVPSRSGSVPQLRQVSGNTLQLGHNSEVSFNDHEEEQPKGEPNTIKKYVPIRRLAEPYSAGAFKSMSDLGEEIELTKPVYLFAPELGLLNIHALTMSLKNYTPENHGEVFTALNTLLVTTTDNNTTLRVSDAPELVDALVELGAKVLNQITEDKDATAVKPETDTVPLSSLSVIDKIFEKYVDKHAMQGEDVALVVDSFTAEEVHDDESDDMIDDLFSPVSVLEVLAPATQTPTPISGCDIPDFMAALTNFREENKYHFSELQTSSAIDGQVFLVDSLITITMVLRNLSFTEDSRGRLSTNQDLKGLLFKIIKSIATHSDKFVFNRNALCLLKDCLVLFERIAFNVELLSLEEAFLIYLLITSFGPKLDEEDDGNPEAQYKIPNAPLDSFTYMPYAIDVFTKILVREPKNRAYLQALLLGTLNLVNSTTHINAGNVTITAHDHQETKRLVLAHLKGNEKALKSGILLTRAFRFYLSCIPFAGGGVEFTRFVFQRSPTILQALFGAKLLINLVPMEELNSPLSGLTTEWLTRNAQTLLFNFTKNSFSLVTESVKFARATNEHRVLSSCGFKSLVVINSLLAKAALLKAALNEDQLEPVFAEKFRGQLEYFRDLYRVQPESDFVLNTLLASSIDPDVAQEVVHLHGLLRGLC